MKHIIRVAGTLAVLAMIGTACAPTETASKADDTGQVAGSNHQDDPTPEAEPADDTQPADEPTEDTGPTILAFGDQAQWPDGLAVTVSKQAPFPAFSYPEDLKRGAHPIRFKVTVVNGTKKPYDPSGYSSSLQSGNTEAEELFDSANGIEGSPSTVVLPGREVTFDVAFAAINTNDLVMQVSPDWDFEREAGIFTNTM